jgi:hypothetical protein
MEGANAVEPATTMVPGTHCAAGGGADEKGLTITVTRIDATRDISANPVQANVRNPSRRAGTSRTSPPPLTAPLMYAPPSTPGLR